MNKIAILIFALAISHAYGQACDSDVKDHFEVVAAATAPPATGNELATSITACSSLEGELACCTAAEIQSQITAELGTFKTQLETDAAARDTDILAARKAVADQYANYALWFAAAASADSVLTTWETTPITGVTDTQATAILASITEIGTLMADFFTNYATIRTAYATYLTTRAACFSEILRYRTVAKCLACHSDADFTPWGVAVAAGAVTVTYGATVETDLAEVCQPYFVASETVTKVFEVERYAAGLEDMKDNLLLIAAANTAGVTPFITASAPATANGIASEIDTATCTTSNCDWIVDTVFENGILDKVLLVQGGTAVTRRRLQSRVLQGGSFAPTDVADEAKVTITFSSDPSAAGNPVDLSALRVGVFSCIVAFFAALLF